MRVAKISQILIILLHSAKNLKRKLCFLREITTNSKIDKEFTLSIPRLSITVIKDFRTSQLAHFKNKKLPETIHQILPKNSRKKTALMRPFDLFMV
jgi:hypothetical protein